MTSSLEFPHWHAVSVWGMYSHSMVAHYLFEKTAKNGSVRDFQLDIIRPQLEQNGFAFYPVATWICEVWKVEDMQTILESLAFEGTDLASSKFSKLMLFVDTNRIKEHQIPSFITKCISDKTFEQDEQERRLLGVGLGRAFVPRANDTYPKFIEKTRIDIDANFSKLQHPCYVVCIYPNRLAVTLLEGFFVSDIRDILSSDIVMLDPVVRYIMEHNTLSYTSC